MADDDDDDLIPLEVLLAKSREKAAAKKKAEEANVKQNSLKLGASSSTKKRENESSSNNKSSSEVKKPKLSTPDASSKGKSSSTTSESKPKSNVFVPKETKPAATTAKPAATSAGGESKPQKKSPAPQVKTSQPSSSSAKKDKKDKKLSFVGIPTGNDLVNGVPRQIKHNLVVQILRRWWYCLDDWPGECMPPPKTTYIDGHIPGIYIGTGAFAGTTFNQRPNIAGKVPSMNSLLTLPTKELQALYVKGLEAQMKDAAGKPSMIKKLEKELKKANKLKVNKIERYYQEAYTALHPGTAKSNKNNNNDPMIVSSATGVTGSV